MALGGKELRILNVDDDEIKRYTVTRLLQRAGFMVEEAQTGQQTLSKAKNLPDLIVLDVNLPDLSGFEVCRSLKSSPATCSIPIVHLTASYLDATHRVYGLEAGADAYLTQDVEPEELIATIKAILRTKAAEENARKLARQWQATFSSITNGICVLSTDGAVERFNPVFGRIFAPDGRNLLNEPFVAMLQAAGRCPISDFAQLAAAQGCTFELVCAGGRTFDTTVDAVKDDDGNSSGFVCSLIETTEKKRANEELKRLETALRERVEQLAEQDYRKDEFIAMLSHELRNPLGAISGALFIMDRCAQDKQPSDQAYEVVKRQVMQLNRLVDDLLDVSRITRGKVELRRDNIELREIIEKAVESVSPAVEEKGLVLDTQIPPIPLPVFADRARLQQVLVNLLNNSVKYSTSGGELSVQAEMVDGSISVKVKDSGIGIAPDILPRIFEPFMQAQKSIDRSEGGLGIGLTVVKQLIEMHGGSVRAESAGIGQGAVFTITIPKSDAAASASTPSEAPQPHSAGTVKQVLVVDDNRDNANMAATVLEAYGYQVHLAYDGISGLAQAETLQPEVVLLDIGLPGLDGYQVAKQLREKSASGLLLVAVSGYGLETDIKRSMEMGFDYHLVKPIDCLQLLTLIERGRPA